jgi:hypothetical protein
MATNTLLNPDMILMETLRVIHQEANFLGHLSKQYDSQYAKNGAKIGDTLRFRLPNQFEVQEDNMVLGTVPNVGEESTSMTVNATATTRFEFNDIELALDIDMFSERYIKPAALKIVAHMENRIMKSVYSQIWNQVYYDSSAATADAFNALIDARTVLSGVPTPMRMRYANVGNSFAGNFIKDNKGLYNPSQQIGRNYREGKITGMVAGFERTYENSLWPIHTYGNPAGTPLVNLAGGIVSEDVPYDGGAAGTKFNTGDPITFVGCNRIHLESKESTNELAQFVVTAGDSAGASGDLKIAPVPVAAGAKKNVSALPANNAAIKLSRGNGITTEPADGDKIELGLGYLSEAIACATADLVLPSGMDMASRQVHDGVSIRFLRGFDIKNSQFISRLDVLYGWKVLRPQFCTRIANKV